MVVRERMCRFNKIPPISSLLLGLSLLRPFFREIAHAVQISYTNGFKYWPDGFAPRCYKVGFARNQVL